MMLLFEVIFLSMAIVLWNKNMMTNKLITNNMFVSKQSSSKNENLSSKIILLWKNLNYESDLLDLINIVDSEMQLESIFSLLKKRKKYTLKQLHFNAYNKEYDRMYTTFVIPKKKKGEFRTIDAPNYILKGIQQCLNYIFEQIYTPNKSAVGFVRDRSIVDGAKEHISEKFIYNIDLKDFFPSISSARIYKRLLFRPFCLNPKLASLIANLCCHKKSDNSLVLPQGAPTSPIISNFICEKLDRKLSKLATAYGLKYTRYADDITFSGMKNVFSEDGKFCKSLRNIIENEEHFIINEEKTRLCHIGMRQEVTGLTVNEKVNVSRKYVKQLRAMINNLEKKGEEEAKSIFIANLAKGKGAYSKHVDINEISINEVIRGKLNFLRMVKGETDPTYQKLKERFYRLDSSASIPLRKERKKKEYLNCSEEESLGLNHDPEFVSRFLHQFTEKKCQALKFTTHYWDKNYQTDEYNYESFEDLKTKYIEILNDNTKSLDKYKDLYPQKLNRKKPSPMDVLQYRCEHLWRTIRNFLVNDDAIYPWSDGEHNWKIGYNKYLKEWMDNNPQQQPFAMPLSSLPSELIPSKPINGKQLSDFGDIVDIFKNCIQFRDDNFYFDIIRIFKSSDIKIDRKLLASLKGKSFFTDTVLVRSALGLIAGNVFQRSEYPNLEIYCTTNNNEEWESITLEILQVGSFSNRDINDVKINPDNDNEDGDLFTIKSKLRNLCDFSIESTFYQNGELKPLRINYLSSNFKYYHKIEEISEQDCRGFKYILRFYNYNVE